MKTIAIPAAFEAATATLHHRPPDIGAFWAAWLKHARRKNVRRDVLAVLLRHYPGYIEVRQFGGIAAVASDRLIREFMPSGLLALDLPDITAVTTWLVSTAGYVLDPIEFAHEEETR